MTRHSSSPRNRRKALHHIRNVKQEALSLFAAKVVLDERLERLVKTICKVEDRLEAEAEAES